MSELVNFADFVKLPLICFHLFGLNLKVFANKRSRNRNIQTVLFYFVIGNLATSVVMFAIYFKENSDDLSSITENLPSVGYALLSVVKTLSIVKRRKKFDEVFETLSELFPRSKTEQESSNVREIFNTYKRNERFFAIMVVFTGLSFILVPVVRLLLTGVWISKLPYQTWYPFDECDPINYNLAFLWHVFINFMTILTLLGPDTALYAFITLISLQFKVLCQRIQEIKKQSVSDLVKYHQTLIRLTENLEKIYSFSILFNFVGSSVLICLLGYQISGEMSLENFFRFPVFLLAAMVQIFILCYYGSKLTNASAQVSDSVYNSRWYIDDSIKLKNSLLLMLHRSQKPSVISAEKFTIVSLKSFSSVSLKLPRYFGCFLRFSFSQVLSWSYSYFTLLQTINDPNKSDVTEEL